MNLDKLFFLKIKVAALLIFVFLFFFPILAVSQDKVILTSHNLYPYGSYPEGQMIKKNADKNYRGIAVDVVTCVFNKLEIPLEILVLPWERAQQMVKKGKADGFFAASQKNSRDDFAVMSVIIANQKWNWYLLKENPNNPNDPSFKTNATVSGFIGANMLKWMQEGGYNVITTPIDTEGLLKILLAKRVDAVMANNYVMEALLEKNNANDKVKTFVNKDKPLGVYFSKDFINSRPSFLENFNSHVAGCRTAREIESNFN